jgi:hypothetical protein
MARPLTHTRLVPRQPTSALGWAMRGLRRASGWTARETARAFGCSPSHITRVELGNNKPSRALVHFYEQQFHGDGLLLCLFEVVEHAAEHERRRAGGHRPRLIGALTGDVSTFVDDTVPHGTLMAPGEIFVKTWRIRNTGCVPWRDRRLERQGPQFGPGLIVSPADVDVPDTEPGEIAEISIALRAPGYDGSSIAYFKMVNVDGFLCFPDSYQLGLDVLIRVADTPDTLQLRQ